MVYQVDIKDDIFISYNDGNGTVHVCPSFHRHNTHELLLVKQGISRIVTENNVAKLSGAFAIFYPSGLAHEQFNDTSQYYCRYCINFQKSLVNDILPYENWQNSFFCIPLDLHKCGRLFSYCYQLHTEVRYNNSDSYTKYRRQKFLLALIINELEPMIVANLNAGEKRQINCNRQIYNVCNYIREHCSESLTLESIAKQFFMSSTKLTRNFRSELDMSVNEYILNARMNKAKRLLNDGMSVCECAEQCGFSTSEYFIKVFRRMIGVTPAKYRKSKEYMLSDEYDRMK